MTDHFENTFLFSCNNNSGNSQKLLGTVNFFLVMAFETLWVCFNLFQFFN